MKILILAVHYEVTGARYIADAFTKLGHDVRTDGNEALLKEAWGVDVPKKYIWGRDLPLNGWKPDLIIIADTDLRTLHYLSMYADYAPLIVWNVDNHVRNMRHIKADRYFLSHYHGPAQPVTQPDETWLPCAAAADVFKPSTIAWENREYDLCCIGVMYPARVQMIERLRAEGFKVFAATGLVYEEYQAAYANSRASLCISAAGDVGQRIFETASIGCLVITDLLRDLEDSETNHQLGLMGIVNTGFTVDHPHNIEATIDQCKRYLRGAFNPMDIEAAKQAAGQLQAIVRHRHDWTNRAQVVIDWFNKEYGVTATITDATRKENGVSDNLTTKNETWQEFGVFVDEKDKPNTMLITKDSPIAVNMEEGVVIISLKNPYLNLGCGTTHLPSAKPAGHEAVDDAVYAYPLWVNVDKVAGVGADKTFDLFTYPWPLESGAYDGALVCHLLEHVPHEIKIASLAPIQQLGNEGSVYDEQGKPLNRQEELDKRELRKKLASLQDGFYAFFSELYRVLTPGAIVHIVSPYGFSDGGITDPSHTRYLTLNTFTHSMTPSISDGSTFKYNNGGINFQVDGQPIYRFTPYAETLHEKFELPYEVLIGTNVNIVYDFYIKLKTVK